MRRSLLLLLVLPFALLAQPKQSDDPRDREIVAKHARGEKIIEEERDYHESRGQALPKMARHRPSIMRDQDSVLLSCKIEECRIGGSSQTGILDVEDINGRLTRAQALRDVGVEVLIRQEADGHTRFEPICRRAASRRAKRSGSV